MNTAPTGDTLPCAPYIPDVASPLNVAPLNVVRKATLGADNASGDEESCRNAMTLQDRRCVVEVVRVAIVEGHGNQRPARTRNAPKRQHGTQRYRPALPREQRHLAIKLLDTDRQVVARVIANAVVKHDRDTRGCDAVEYRMPGGD